MHFGFALDLSDIDLLNIDSIDQRYTHLDLLDTDIPVNILFASKTSWRRLQDMSSRRLQDMSSRRLEDVFRVTIFRLPIFRFTLKTCWRHFRTCLKDVLKTNKCLLERIYKNYLSKYFWNSIIWQPSFYW